MWNAPLVNTNNYNSYTYILFPEHALFAFICKLNAAYISVCGKREREGK